MEKGEKLNRKFERHSIASKKIRAETNKTYLCIQPTENYREHLCQTVAIFVLDALKSPNAQKRKFYSKTEF